MSPPNWRLARSLEQLRAQINALAPNRNRSHDGAIGDAAHAARKSDHNPDERGIVHAMDITVDAPNGCDAGLIAEALRCSRDRRISYVIWNRRIFSTTVRPWQWRPYDGANPHTKHVHISVNVEHEDDMATWQIGATAV